ncbi:hypothetical protein ACFS7Z_03550 [Pontibacter toksunensis]|uniref:Lipocalin-like domain-containing protein n=1 Tax=Pontibacter toksunensis TaxID=1332631 RepID=A0ABW6BQ74_9BACT
MINLRNFTLLLTSIFMLALAGCSKDDDDDVSPNIAMLTAGEWKGSAVFSNGVDITKEVEEKSGFVWQNFTTVFNRDGSYVESYDGDTIDEGVWVYENDERVIKFNSGTTNEYKVVISKLDEDELSYLQGGLELMFTR